MDMTKNNIFPPECGRHNSFKQYTVCNPTPEFSDKNLWFQSISVNFLFEYAIKKTESAFHIAFPKD
jgi:hypothetical protein